MSAEKLHLEALLLQGAWDTTVQQPHPRDRELYSKTTRPAAGPSDADSRHRSSLAVNLTLNRKERPRGPLTGDPDQHTFSMKSQGVNISNIWTTRSL